MAILSCPTCGGRFDSNSTPAMPFCSRRCRQIDLRRWLNEEQSLPIAPDPDAESEQPWMDEEEEEL